MRAPTTRELVLIGAGLVGVSTAATSAVSLYELAAACGIPEPFAAALPIALDAGAGVAALVWITERGELRAWGRGIAIGALAATLVFNGIQHALTTGQMTTSLPLVLAVGAVIPAVLWSVAHLAALMTTAPPRPAARRTTAPPTTRPTAAPTSRARGATPAAAGKRAAGLDWARTNWPATGKAIALATGVSRAEGDRIRARVKAEMEAAS